MTASFIDSGHIKSMRNFALILLLWVAITMRVATATKANLRDGISNRETSYDQMSRSSSGGDMKPRIFDGAPVSEPIPFIVSIYVYVPKFREYVYFCAGSLISSTRIATAAHCFHEFVNHAYKSKLQFKASFGSVLNSPIYAPVTRAFGVSHVSLDRRWEDTKTKPNPYPFDIAVISLPEPVPFSTAVQPVELANSSSYSPDPIVVAGWGKYDCERVSSQLLYAVGEIVPNRECEKIISADYEGGIVEFGNDKFCALVHAPEKNTTNTSPSNVDEGDSGGPLFRIMGKKMILLGITSFGYKNDSGRCVRNDIPQVFSKVSASTEFLLYGGCVSLWGGGWNVVQIFTVIPVLLQIFKL